MYVELAPHSSKSSETVVGIKQAVVIGSVCVRDVHENVKAKQMGVPAWSSGFLRKFL